MIDLVATFKFSRLPTFAGLSLMLGLGAFNLVIALTVRTMVRSTHDFVIAGRKIGLGLGVGSVIAVWTWSMAVMMSSAQAYTWGVSGLVWFVVPNGLAVMVMVPFALHLRRHMPAGYTLVQFMRERFESQAANTLTLVLMMAGLTAEILINLFGVVLVAGTIYGLPPLLVLIVALGVVTLYSYFGGLTTSAVTASINTLLISVPSALVVLLVLSRVGGAQAMFASVRRAGQHYVNPFDGAAAAGFGISLALGLLASTVADQTFWQKVWALKPDKIGRTFLWAGAWFYPIPLTLGLLGLVGLGLGVRPAAIPSGASAVGPYVIASVGLPVLAIVVYTLLVLNACYSATDGAFSALSSLVAVDVVKRFFPTVSEKRLFQLTKASIVVAGVVGGLIVATGIDYVTLVNAIFFVKAAILVPVVLSITWRRMSAVAYVAGIALAIVAGLPVYVVLGSLPGILVLLSVSVVLSVGLSLLSRRTFDFAVLQDAGRRFRLTGADERPDPGVEVEEVA